MRPLSYAGYRFPPEIIQHAIWLYLRFTLSFRDVEELLAERGIDVSHETIRRWVAVFGPMIARRLRAMRPKPHTTWHLDEMFVSIGGKRMYLWRAVDAEGEVLDCLVQSRRNKRAALRLMRKLIRKYRMVPSKFVTDRLPSYAAARAELPVTDRARERLATEQPGRELACPGATTRAKDATLPVSRIGSEIPLSTCFGLQHFQHLSPSHHVCNEASVPHRGLRGMALGAGGRSSLVRPSNDFYAARIDRLAARDFFQARVEGI